ncbi:MAG: 2-dehydro-3-deoxygalactonokinase [Rhodobacteraceae bacterium]|nr:2-dehydro-3-deoxygalactonokinase [Paracoccaceae bacterium]
MSAPDWIAADWGSAHLRVWGLSGDQVIRHASSDQGMGQLAREGFEPALLALVGDWLPEGQVTPVVVCGMAGSRQGWVEAPFRALPCAPLGGPLVQATCRDLRLAVHVVPGLKQVKPADVICGEETRIAGFLVRNPGWDGVICLPGTHSKWVHVSAGEVVSCQSFLTGEMFSLLSKSSVLRHSVAGWADEGFAEGVAQGMERPERLMARLFSIRAEGLLEGRDPAFARARLSGLMIGAELAAAKPYWLGQRVAVIGAEPLVQHYAQALGTFSVPVTRHDATEMTLAGLATARALLPQTKRPCVN